MPPTRILIEICRQIRGVAVDGHDIFAAVDLAQSGLIRGDEAVLVGLLRKHGPVCRTEDLRELAVRAGVGGPSFWRCLSFCPTITRYAQCVHGLTGALIQPGLVQSLAGVRRRTGLVRDHGWTADGKVWIAYRVSRSAIESGVVSVPAAKAELIQGEFALSTASPAGSGQLTVKQTNAWGIGPFLRRTHSEEGDCLLLIFDPRGRTATASVADDTLIEQFQDDVARANFDAPLDLGSASSSSNSHSLANRGP